MATGRRAAVSTAVERAVKKGRGERRDARAAGSPEAKPGEAVASPHSGCKLELATPSGFEPPISTLTGWRVRPLHHGASRISLRSSLISGNVDHALENGLRILIWVSRAIESVPAEVGRGEGEAWPSSGNARGTARRRYAARTAREEAGTRWRSPAGCRAPHCCSERGADTGRQFDLWRCRSGSAARRWPASAA